MTENANFGSKSKPPYYWAFLGLAIALSLMGYMFVNATELRLFQILCIAQWAFLMIHQFEEYAYLVDLRVFYNLYVYNKSRMFKFPLNNKAILWVNVIFGWTVYFLAIIYYNQYPWMGTGLAGVLLMNGLLHVAMWISLKKYNPGLITGIFLFIPLGIFAISQANTYLNDHEKWFALLTFIIGTVAIPLTIQFTQPAKI